MEALPAPRLASVALGFTPLHAEEGRRPQPTQLSSAMLRTWLQRYTNLPALPSVREAARPALLLAALSRLNPGVADAPNLLPAHPVLLPQQMSPLADSCLLKRVCIQVLLAPWPARTPQMQRTRTSKCTF